MFFILLMIIRKKNNFIHLNNTGTFWLLVSTINSITKYREKLNLTNKWFKTTNKKFKKKVFVLQFKKFFCILYFEEL